MNKRLITNFSWWFFLIILTISSVGVVVIYSANQGRPETFFQNLYLKQILWIGCGLIAMFLALVLDYRIWSQNAYFIFVLTIISLLYTLFYGDIASGAQRWIRIGPLIIQVSEFAKFSLIILLAKLFEARKLSKYYEFSDIIIPGLLTGVICFLIALQPDLGTAMIILFVFFVFIFALEFRTRVLLQIFFLCLTSLPLLWFFLKDYQKTRILTLFSPELDPLGAGYHSIQSKIAIGSGGFWGQGLFAGTQSRLNFLPEKHTDFIFSVFAEEMGFSGVIVLFTLYLIVIIKGLNIASRASDRFGLFLALGITGSITFYIVVNIGMAIGLFPITGIPLPLLSYGGSSLITCFFAFGLLLNIEMRRIIH